MTRTTTVITRAPRVHGSVAGYAQHIRQRENPCDECKQANRAYHRARYVAAMAEKERKREEARLAATALLKDHQFIVLRPAECDGLTGACTCQVWTTKKTGAKVAFNWHLRQIKEVTR